MYATYLKTEVDQLLYCLAIHKTGQNTEIKKPILNYAEFFFSSDVNFDLNDLVQPMSFVWKLDIMAFACCAT